MGIILDGSHDHVQYSSAMLTPFCGPGSNFLGVLLVRFWASAFQVRERQIAERVFGLLQYTELVAVVLSWKRWILFEVECGPERLRHSVAGARDLGVDHQERKSLLVWYGRAGGRLWVGMPGFRVLIRPVEWIAR
jgi:hypothetical protein